MEALTNNNFKKWFEKKVSCVSICIYRDIYVMDF